MNTDARKRDVYLVKLLTGETIICFIPDSEGEKINEINEENGWISIEKPFQLLPVANRGNQLGFMLVPYIPFDQKKSFTLRIRSSAIVCVSKAPEEFSNNYRNMVSDVKVPTIEDLQRISGKINRIDN